jgi:hypothetical protein
MRDMKKFIMRLFFAGALLLAAGAAGVTIYTSNMTPLACATSASSHSTTTCGL